MSDIINAVTSLRERLEKSEYSHDLVVTIAEDWEVNPILLERKFFETFGMSPEEAATKSTWRNRISFARKDAGIMARNFAPASLSFDLGDGRAPMRVNGVVVTTVNRKDYVVIAIHEGQLMAIELGNAKSHGNPISTLSIDKDFKGIEELTEQLRKSFNLETPKEKGDEDIAPDL